jgi:galactokinase
VLGARMMGGGFGGCTLSLVRRDALEAIIATVAPAYTSATGFSPSFYAVELDDGLREIAR